MKFEIMRSVTRLPMQALLIPRILCRMCFIVGYRTWIQWKLPPTSKQTSASELVHVGDDHVLSYEPGRWEVILDSLLR